MAYDDEQQVEVAFDTLESITDKIGNLRTDLKQTFYNPYLLKWEHS